MSGGPFRELFVELSRVAFEQAKALGEAAVEQAKQKQHDDRGMEYVIKQAYAPSRETRLIEALSVGLGERYMADHFGWQEFSIERHIYGHLRVSGRLGCGHFHRVDVDARVIMLAERGEMIHVLVEAIEKRLAVKPRLCFCTPGPA